VKRSDEYLEDPLTGEMIHGNMEEENDAYVTLEAQAEESSQNLWMVPFADLMSTMVILFLALFGYAYLQSSTTYERAVLELQQDLAEDERRPALAQMEKETELAQAMETYFDKTKLKELAEVELTAHRIKISLSNPVLFDLGEAGLKPAAKDALGALTDLIREVPNPVLVEGHTDDTPIVSGRYRSNFELSAARSFAVIDFFIRQGLPPARFSSLGYGEYKPVAPNDTEDNRAKNRRRQITILRENP